MSHDKGLFSLRSFRFFIAVLLMMAFFCTVSMRANLGMAMVCMVNDTAAQMIAARPPSPLAAPMAPFTDHVREQQCRRPNDTNHPEPGYQGSFAWSPQQQSLLFSATFWGGLITILPSGFIVDRYGPKWALFFAVAVYSIFTLLSPMLALQGFEWLFMGRFVMGFGEGFAIPSISAIIVRWFPVAERSTVTAMYTSGNQLAGMLTTLVAAELCASQALGGWPTIFYLLGTIGTLCSLLWLIFASNNPANHRLVGSCEQAYLHKELQANPSAISKSDFKKIPIPWRKMASSLPVYANIVGMFIMDFGDTIIISYLPTFFKEILYLDVQLNGIFTAVPFVTQLIAKNMMALVADLLKKRKIISNTASCKIFQSIASFGSFGAFLALGTLVDCTTPLLALTLITGFSIVNGAIVPGTMTSMISISPAYTGTLLSVYQAFGTIAGVMSPILVGYINDQGTLDEWQRIFLLTAFVYLCGGIVFLLFGSGEVQYWAEPSTIFADVHPQSILPDNSDMKSDQLLINSC